MTCIPDLRIAEPRPMDATLDGYAWLPRLIDKARAARAGTLGDLVHPCPVDRKCLGLLRIDARTFGDIAEQFGDDDEILAELQRRGIPTAAESWFDAPAFEDSLHRKQ
jgi:Domain of unknown function (DUF5069)